MRINIETPGGEIETSFDGNLDFYNGFGVLIGCSGSGIRKIKRARSENRNLCLRCNNEPVEIGTALRGKGCPVL